MARFDVAVIGAGPAGLSAALNLVRARRTVVVIDGNRPRNAATLHSHGFLTRDGVPPLELRRLGREEFERYPGAEFETGVVTAVAGAAGGFFLTVAGVRGGAEHEVEARAVLIATGLSETLPELPSIRHYYGTWLHSCIECDGYEKADQPLALIGETDDLAMRAVELSQWSSDIVVFTNGVGQLTAAHRVMLSTRGIRVVEEPIADLVGEKAVLRGVRLASGEVVERTAGFVRPVWTAQIGFAAGLGVAVDDRGFVRTDASGRTSAAGVYAAGDVTAPGPQQLIIAAGAGAAVAAWINRDLLVAR